ncbi:MAG: glycosyltransferase [Candidatus Hodarchaeota archaeon]
MRKQAVYQAPSVHPAQEERIPEVSVVVPISERHDDITQLYKLYAKELEGMKKGFEFLFILDGDFPHAGTDLQKLKKEGHPVRIIKFAKNFGESTALMEGFRQARGSKILTLASYIQIEPADLAKLFSAYDEGNDLVITRRHPRKDPLVNRIQSAIYHYLVSKLTGTHFKDITSGMRLIDKKLLSEFVLYGDLHRFIPIFAMQRGIKTKEVTVTQRREDTQLRLVRPGAYLRRILDILTLFFLVKFTRKPLRFFGLIGAFLFLSGLVITAYLSILRLFFAMALSNRPLLLLGILLIVFGIQMFSVGLVGELILFSHAKETSDYKIEEIIE